MRNPGIRKKNLMTAREREIQAAAENDYPRWPRCFWRHCFVAAFFVATLGVAADAAHGALNEVHKLTASDAATGDVFGASVAISGNVAIVGAIRDDNDGGSSTI